MIILNSFISFLSYLTTYDFVLVFIAFTMVVCLIGLIIKLIKGR